MAQPQKIGSASSEMALLATDWQHQNRKRPNTANNANASKWGLTCGFVEFQSCQIIVRWLSGGGSAGSNPAAGASISPRH
jgi:hypothetical protein